MKIMINRQPKRTPWGGGTHFVTLFADYMAARGHTVIHQFSYGIDAIMMIDPRPEDGINDVNKIKAYKFLNPKVRVIHRINDTDIARGTNFLDQLNIEANAAVADKTVFISQWLRDYYVERGFDPNRPHTVITNGCNLDLYCPQERPPLDDRKLKIVTHHWSDNFNKGFDAYIGLDKYMQVNDDIEFTYVGRYFSGYKPVKTKVIPPLYGPELAKEIGNHDIYLTGARYEACGMHHIEGAACGMPVLYHKNGGGVNEMCSRYGLAYDETSLFQAIQKVKDNLPEFRQKVADHRDSLSSEKMCQLYREQLENI
jgi:glycosyltransferase involved in cell wall biosynthesis